MILNWENFIQIILFAGSLLLTIQGLITLTWMVHAWNNNDKLEKEKRADSFSSPNYSFTAIVPIRFEDKVISETIQAINNINYPKHLKEIIIVIRSDDQKTINKAQEVVTNLQNECNRVVVLVDTHPINKPVSLNGGLGEAKNQIITIFDAEDEPHPDIYNIVNSTLVKENADVIQSGVSLMNYNSYWFSPLNVMEYFFWFKSGIHFFNNIGRVAFLGGNTVFIKKKLLTHIGGWDEYCLTEDADIGIRLSAINAKTKVVYDERYVTKEETPATIESFIKQRTRWNQGFFQIFLKGDWRELPTLRQKAVAMYILLAPFFPILLFFYTPFGVFVSLIYKVPVALAIFSFIPFYILFGNIALQCIGLYEFTRAYKFKYYWYLPFKVLLTYFPYMAILNLSAIRALFRALFSVNSWEKTTHLNSHRNVNPAINKNSIS